MKLLSPIQNQSCKARKVQNPLIFFADLWILMPSLAMSTVPASILASILKLIGRLQRLENKYASRFLHNLRHCFGLGRLLKIMFWWKSTRRRPPNLPPLRDNEGKCKLTPCPSLSVRPPLARWQSLREAIASSSESSLPVTILPLLDPTECAVPVSSHLWDEDTPTVQSDPSQASSDSPAAFSMISLPEVDVAEPTPSVVERTEETVTTADWSWFSYPILPENMARRKKRTAKLYVRFFALKFFFSRPTSVIGQSPHTMLKPGNTPLKRTYVLASDCTLSDA